TLARPVAIPMISNTTIISSRLKPAWVLGPVDALVPPGADVRIEALAPGLPIGPQGKHIDLAMHARIQVLIGGAPGIIGQTVHIVRALALRVAQQRGEALLAGGITSTV